MMRKLGFVVGLLLIPYGVFAAEVIEEGEGATLILQSYTFWSSIIIAIMAIVSTIVIAKKMKGGVFGETLNLFAYGMVAILVGYIIESLPFLNTITFFDSIADILFIMGFLFMAMAGNLMSKVVTG